MSFWLSRHKIRGPTTETMGRSRPGRGHDESEFQQTAVPHPNPFYPRPHALSSPTQPQKEKPTRDSRLSSFGLLAIFYPHRSTLIAARISRVRARGNYERGIRFRSDGTLRWKSNVMMCTRRSQKSIRANAALKLMIFNKR